MAPRKVGLIPAKADSDKQERLIKEELEPRLEEAKSSKRVVFFVDAAQSSDASRLLDAQISKIVSDVLSLTS